MAQLVRTLSRNQKVAGFKSQFRAHTQVAGLISVGVHMRRQLVNVSLSQSKKCPQGRIKIKVGM